MTVNERILEFIREYTRTEGRPPAVRDIGREVGKSPSVVKAHLDRLVRDGKVRRRDGEARSLELTEDPVPIPDDGERWEALGGLPERVELLSGDRVGVYGLLRVEELQEFLMAESRWSVCGGRGVMGTPGAPAGRPGGDEM